MALSKQLQRIHEAIMTIKQLGGVFGRNPTFNNVTIEGTLTFDGDIDINSDLTISGNLYLPDNSKAIFGDNDDLQIYHDGSNSYISEQGTGDLRVYAQDFQIRNADGSNTMLYANAPTGGIQLFHTGAEKLATSASGISVTGTVTADGVTVDGSLGQIALQSSGAELHFSRNGNNDLLANGGSSAALTIGANDNVRFLTGGSERMRIDVSGNLLVGQTVGNVYNQAAVSGLKLDGANGNIQTARLNNPSLLLNRYGTDGDIAVFYKDGAPVGSIGTAASGNIFYQGGASRAGVEFGSTSFIPFNNGVRADATNDLGVNSSRFKDLYLSGVSYNGDGSAAAPSISFGADTNTGFYRVGSDQIGFVTGGSIKAKLDASGNLLVGKTASDLGVTAGIELNGQYDVGYFTRSAEKALVVNRLSTDGTIAEFRQDGAPVGSIGAESGRVFMYGNSTYPSGIRLGNNVLEPSNSSGTVRDALTSLGGSSSRFKDLYLSGGVYLGGTGAANHLDSYEEGTWTVTVADAASGGNESSSAVTGTYTKVGKMVYVQFNVSNIDTTGLTAGNDVYITGLPFATASVTGTAKYTGTAQLSAVTFSGTPFLSAVESATVLRIVENSSGTGVDFVVVSQLASSASDIHGNLVYQTT
jgi:hypothetical protein